MVNYDLPWNPNRLEQRFGRIHHIGQIEVCHLWNLVASETREGEIFLVTRDEILTVLNKLDEFVLALVEVEGEAASTPRYARRPFDRKPDFGVTCIHYNLYNLMARAQGPT